MQDKKTMWGGRFSQQTNSFVQKFTSSISFDNRLYKYDIQGSIAHATMLASTKIITNEESKQIIEGLNKIEKQIENGDFEWSIALEDVHMNIEQKLTELIGNVGKKLHTARSRNDQVATDIRLYLKEVIQKIVMSIDSLTTTLIMQAEENIDVIMPGMTHLQIAQPIRFSHHLTAWLEMLLRDKERFLFAYKQADSMPLGSAALAGTSFPIDRKLTSELLNFSHPSRNSLDSVSNRDFIIDFLSASSQLITHFSRWSEELILWSSTQFSWINIPDEFCTGSSIMPQKKNADVPELIRGKSGRVYGNLMAMLTLMKSQPLAYNKDNQEDKELLFDSVDTTLDCLTAMNGMLAKITPRKENMLADANKGFSVATDLADYLVRNGVAFRDAHEITGKLVKMCEKKNIRLDELSLESMQEVGNMINKDVFDYLSVEGSVESRSHIGGTAKKTILTQLRYYRKLLANNL